MGQYHPIPSFGKISEIAFASKSRSWIVPPLETRNRFGSIASGFS